MAGDHPPLIVGIDGSERSRDALALAARLAESGQSMLLVHVHRYGDLSTLVPEGEYEQLLHEVAEATFFAVQDTLNPATPREMRLLSGRSPAAGLHEVAEKTHASLIVVGSSERSGLGRVLAGSVAESTLIGSPVPVAVAPRGYAGAAGVFATVGCGFDGSRESEAALIWADVLARRSGARLRALAVNTPLAFGGIPGGAIDPTTANRALRHLLEERTREAINSLPDGAPVDGKVLDGDAAGQLIAASAELDLLALGSRGYGPLRSVLVGSVSRALARSAECPVVVLPRGVARDVVQAGPSYTQSPMARSGR